MADEVAKAYIQLVPSAQGIKGAITAQLGGEADEAGTKAGEGFSKAFGGALGTIGKVAAAAIAAAAAAAVKVAKDAVDGFADYEQLTGGVETLFKDSSDKVLKYAQDAYKTAGMSANKYMETVTGFSASLLQSLGGDTDRAAGVADMAIRDMADNANKMGTDIQSIQNAYQGFAKQNYTMLDNLKLGYGGTKEEMERLLQDATKLSGVEYDITSLNDVYQAIHVIQGELGITGTTAAEASETISGSVASMKSSWSNLVSSLANPDADLGERVSEFAESAKTALKNILPAVSQALSGVGQLISELAPVIADALPTLVRDVLPSIVKAAVSIVQAIVDVLNDEDAVDTLVDAAVDILITIADAIADNIDKIIEAASKIIVALLNKLTEEETIEAIIEAAVKLIIAIAKGLINAAGNILEALAKVFAKMLYAIGQWEADLLEKGKELVAKIGEGIAQAAKNALNWGRDLIDNFVQGIKERIQKVIDTVKGIAENIKQYLGFSEPELGPLSDFHTFAPDMMELFAQGIRQNANLITDAVGNTFDFGPQIVDYGMSGARTSNLTTQGETVPAAVTQEQNISLYATINLDGAALWQGLLPYKRMDEAMTGVPLI